MSSEASLEAAGRLARARVTGGAVVAMQYQVTLGALRSPADVKGGMGWWGWSPAKRYLLGVGSGAVLGAGFPNTVRVVGW